VRVTATPLGLGQSAIQMALRRNLGTVQSESSEVSHRAKPRTFIVHLGNGVRRFSPQRSNNVGQPEHAASEQKVQVVETIGAALGFVAGAVVGALLPSDKTIYRAPGNDFGLDFGHLTVESKGTLTIKMSGNPTTSYPTS
jgi:hypothetical protein